jgi:hypothetical protein
VYYYNQTIYIEIFHFLLGKYIMYQNKISSYVFLSLLIIIMGIILLPSFYEDTAVTAAAAPAPANNVGSGSSIDSSTAPSPGPIASPSNSHICNCVVFRIDDISDNHVSSSIAVMNLFISENKSLTLGIVMNHIGRNPVLMEKIMDGTRKGLFELALHGYDHLNYLKLPASEQLDQLSLANQRMQDLLENLQKYLFHHTIHSITIQSIQ